METQTFAFVSISKLKFPLPIDHVMELRPMRSAAKSANSGGLAQKLTKHMNHISSVHILKKGENIWYRNTDPL